MKKAIYLSIIAVLFSALINSTRGQLIAHVGIGYGTTAQKPVGELFIGADWHYVTAMFGIQTHISSAVSAPSILEAKLGRTIWLNESLQLHPQGGYAFQMYSNDIKGGNKHSYVVSLDLIKQLADDRAQLYLSVSNSGTQTLITAGIRGIFY